MPLCTYAARQQTGCTVVENAFILHFMPYADDTQLKVYLLGLSLCQDPLCADNSVQGMCDRLDMDPDALLAAFRYWENLGLLQITSQQPLAVSYRTAAGALEPSRLIPKDKYNDFVVQIQTFYPDRLLSSNEIYQYLSFLQDTSMQPDALLMIARFCIDRKDTALRPAYILTVARNWYNEGCTTIEQVEARIAEVEASGEEMRAVFRALRKTAAPDVADRQMYIKWTRNWGFAHDAVLAAAKLVKKGGMSRLDALLDQFFRLNLFTAQDIADYAKRKDAVYDLAVRVNKILGLYYESLDYVIETYYTPWMQQGYSDQGLVLIAKLCALRGERTLQGMNDTVAQFYAQGVISDADIAVKLDELTRTDKVIASVIAATGASRSVTAGDRQLYRTWSAIWGFDDRMILLAAQYAQGKPYAFANIGSRLSKWRAAGITTTDAARLAEEAAATTTAAKPKSSAPAVAPVAGSEFRRAEIRAALAQDVTYRKLDQTVRSLEMQQAHFQLQDQPVPAVLLQQYRQAQQDLHDRIVQLGYDPQDV